MNMLTPGQGRLNLATRDDRIAFLVPLMAEQATVSARDHGCADYGDHVGKLAEAFADIIGDRRGRYRDQVEFSRAIERLVDVGFGFLKGLGESQPNIHMLNSWASAVIQNIDRSFD